MCVIVTSQADTMPSLTQLARMSDANPDGAGIAWHDGQRLHRYRNEDNMKTLAFIMDHWQSLETSPFLLHFRLATHGRVCTGNTHPFRFSKGDRTGFIAHNGIAHSYTRGRHASDSRNAILAWQAGQADLADGSQGRFALIRPQRQARMAHRRPRDHPGRHRGHRSQQHQLGHGRPHRIRPVGGGVPAGTRSRIRNRHRGDRRQRIRDDARLHATAPLTRVAARAGRAATAPGRPKGSNRPLETGPAPGRRSPPRRRTPRRGATAKGNGTGGTARSPPPGRARPPYGAHARAPGRPRRAPAGHAAAWSPPRAGTAKTRGLAFFGPSKHTRVGEPVNAAAHAAGRRGVAS